MVAFPVDIFASRVSPEQDTKVADVLRATVGSIGATGRAIETIEANFCVVLLRQLRWDRFFFRMVT